METATLAGRASRELQVKSFVVVVVDKVMISNHDLISINNSCEQSRPVFHNV